MTTADYISTVLPRLEGWCTPAKAERLVALITAHRPRLFVEIGVFGGRSLFAAALALSALPQSDGRLAIGLDPWECTPATDGYTGVNREWWGKLDYEAIYRGCHVTLGSLALQSICHLLRATSSAALPLITRLSPINMLHIDGNHSEASALHDVEHYVPLVGPGGVVLFDDLGWETTKPAQQRLLTFCHPVGEVDGCGVFERK